MKWLTRVCCIWQESCTMADYIELKSYQRSYLHVVLLELWTRSRDGQSDCDHSCRLVYFITTVMICEFQSLYGVALPLIWRGTLTWINNTNYICRHHETYVVLLPVTTSDNFMFEYCGTVFGCGPTEYPSFLFKLQIHFSTISSSKFYPVHTVVSPAQ